jgi:hypothetical protein
MAHEINRAYCQSIGDDSQPDWQHATEHAQASALAGVDMHLANPDATPKDSHDAWLKAKEEAGWTFGPVKDESKKEHPCMVPYEDLPESQKAKDYLFRGVVHVLAAIFSDRDKEHVFIPAGVPVVSVDPESRVAIKYVGARESYVDGAFGTRIRFERGVTVLVPAAVAARMLQHPDVYVLGEPGEVQAAQTVPGLRNDENPPEVIQELRDQIALMDKKALATFAEQKFRQTIDKRQTVGELRAHVTGLLDQYGV